MLTRVISNNFEDKFGISKNPPGIVPIPTLLTSTPMS